MIATILVGKPLPACSLRMTRARPYYDHCAIFVNLRSPSTRQGGTRDPIQEPPDPNIIVGDLLGSQG